MKIDRQEVYDKYMTWVDQVSDDLPEKSRFSPMEIVNKICDIIENK